MVNTFQGTEKKQVCLGNVNLISKIILCLNLYVNSNITCWDTGWSKKKLLADGWIINKRNFSQTAEQDKDKTNTVQWSCSERKGIKLAAWV